MLVPFEKMIKPAGWLAQLGSFLSNFKLPGAELSFERGQ